MLSLNYGNRKDILQQVFIFERCFDINREIVRLFWKGKVYE